LKKMTQWLCGAYLVFAISLVLGCGESSTEVPVDPPGLTVRDLIKQDLQMIIDNGQLGSEMMSIENNLEKLKAENSGKAEELQKDLDELEKASGAKVKSIAQQMMNKL